MECLCSDTRVESSQSRVKAFLEPKQTNVWAGIGKGLVKKVAWEGTKSLGKHGGQLGWGLAEQAGRKGAVIGGMKSGFTSAAENLGKSSQYGGGIHGRLY